MLLPVFYCLLDDTNLGAIVRLVIALRRHLLVRLDALVALLLMRQLLRGCFVIIDHRISIYAVVPDLLCFGQWTTLYDKFHNANF